MMNVKSCMMDTILSHSGTCDLTKSVNIKTIDMQNTLDFLAHFLRPWLCAMDSGFEFQSVNYACFLHRLCQIQCIRGRTCKCSRAKIFHAHHLTFRVACRHRNCHCSQRFRTEIQAKPSGKQAISVANMQHIFIRQSRHRKASGHALPPHVNIFL